MKILVLLCLVGLLSGCSLLSRSPSESTARQFESREAERDREMAIQARAGDYERAGVDRRNAQRAAETEANRSGS